MAQLFLFLGCGGSNTPSTGTAGTNGAAAGTTGSGTAGTTGAAAGTDGSGTAGTTGSGTAGTTGTGGAPPGTPACGNTAAGVAIAKNGSCTAADTQLCYKTCGPASSGFKSETCSGDPGVYNEGDCTFPPGDYSAYAIPTSIPADCPTTAPEAGSAQPACTVAAGIVCGGYSNNGTPTQTTGYLDSTGAAKVGYCVCAGATTMHWSCASTTAWPCPATMSGVTGC